MSLLISVVTPSYNQAAYIKATLDSVLTQDYPHVEHIVMDGASTDGTQAILQAYQDDRLTWKSEADSGQSDAINKGMRLTRGDILAYLNSDDLYLPGTLAYVANFFETHPEADILYGCVHTIDSSGAYTGPDYLVGPITLNQYMTRRFKFPQQAVFWRRRVYEALGDFDESLHYQMDYDYWIRALLAGFRMVPTEKFLAAFREHDSSKTVSQAVKFWKDWQTIIDKVYARADLSPELQALKPLAYVYVDHHAAEHFIKYGSPADARPYLQRVLRADSAPLRLKLVTAAMLVDTYLNTPFEKWLNRLDRTVKALRT